MSKDVKASFFYLLIIISLCYSNSLRGSWHFDDLPNIVNNSILHINNLLPQTLWRTFFTQNHDFFFRPIPCLTFAINWYLCGNNTIGYHIVNIAIHVLTSFFLLLTTLLFFKTPSLKKYQYSDAYFISFLSVILWAVNPIQTQAVNYIVQRMALLVAMFYVLSLYFYLRGKLSECNKSAMLYYGASFAFWVFGLLSKENAMLLPFSIFLVDLVFFENIIHSGRYKRLIIWPVVFLCIAGVVWVVFFKKGNFLFFLDAYSDRPFTLLNRIMTEPRIIFFYLSQIFYPSPERFSIAHDIVISKSFLSPWTTIFSITTIFLLISGCLLNIRKMPIVSFSVLFYFLNHVIESGFFALELIFEHRNYLPSFFIFLPFACLMRFLITFYKNRSRIIYITVPCLLTMIVVFFGYSTFIRNIAWDSELSLWHDAMKKAPLEARPVWNVAFALSDSRENSTKNYNTILFLYNKALSLNLNKKSSYPNLLMNYAFIYYQKKDYLEAIKIYKESLEIDPAYMKARFHMIMSLMHTGDFIEASDHADILINQSNGMNVDYLDIKGLILLWTGRYEEALKYFNRSLLLSNWNSRALLNIGCTFGKMGDYKRSVWFLKRSLDKTPDDLFVYISIIENCIRADNKELAGVYTEEMLGKFPLNLILQKLKNSRIFQDSIPVSGDIVKVFIEQCISNSFIDIKSGNGTEVLTHHI